MELEVERWLGQDPELNSTTPRVLIESFKLEKLVGCKCGEDPTPRKKISEAAREFLAAKGHAISLAATQQLLRNTLLAPTAKVCATTNGVTQDISVSSRPAKGERRWPQR